MAVIEWIGWFVESCWLWFWRSRPVQWVRFQMLTISNRNIDYAVMAVAALLTSAIMFYLVIVGDL